MGIWEDFFGDHENPWFDNWQSENDRKSAVDDWFKDLMAGEENEQ